MILAPQPEIRKPLPLMPSRRYSPSPKSPTAAVSLKFGTRYGIAACALTMLILAFSVKIGPIAIVAMYGLWFPHLTRGGKLIIRPTGTTVAVFALPLLACLSVLWSDDKTATLKASLEFLSMILCVMVAARTIDTKSLILGVLLGSTLVVAGALATRDFEPDFLTGKMVLIGRMGSKNQVGFYASLGLYFGLGLLPKLQKPGPALLILPITVPVCAAALYFCHSATSVVALMAVFAATFMMQLLCRFPRAVRGPLLTTVTVSGIVFGSLAVALGAYGAVLKMFGKSSDLTGRTDLWATGLRIGSETPVAGHGYAAFWVQGRPEAEALWYEFDIATRTGFHFHNMHVETFVELGLIGAGILAALLLASLIKSAARVIRDGGDAESMACFGISVLFLVRSFAEVDFLGPFTVGVFMFYSVLVRLAEYRGPVVLRRRSLRHLKEPALGAPVAG